MKEIVYSIILNIKCIIETSLIVSFITMILVGLKVAIDNQCYPSEKDIAFKNFYLTKMLKYFLIYLLVVIPIVIIPTPEQLFKMRVELIKLELTKPENINKGLDEINRLEKELECKYLQSNCQ